jgi:tripartite-type tricarboxylate transporter receptor subunit TctC
VTGGVILSVDSAVPRQEPSTELVEYVKANPAEADLAAPGPSVSPATSMMEWLKRQTGMQITHVP